jgi:hypothetical protein
MSVFGFACGDYACVLITIAHKAAGASLSTRHSLRPLFSLGVCFAKLGRIAPRECGGVFSVIASEAKQSRAGQFLDCFVANAPRNDSEAV